MPSDNVNYKGSSHANKVRFAWFSLIGVMRSDYIRNQQPPNQNFLFFVDGMKMTQIAHEVEH